MIYYKNLIAEQHDQIKLINMGEIPAKFSPKKFAIQTAVEQAAGNIILATDADCRVQPNWIERMVSYFEPHIGFVVGFSQFGRKGERQNLIEKFQAFDFVTFMGAAVGTMIATCASSSIEISTSCEMFASPEAAVMRNCPGPVRASKT